MIKNKSVHKLIELALSEDLSGGDSTSDATISNNKKITAKFVCKEDGFFSGGILIPLIIKIAKKKGYIKYPITFKQRVKDGNRAKKGSILGVLNGRIKDVLALERTLLNFISRMSGVATYTNTLVTALGKSKVNIYDTRKTLPGWRFLDKYAVLCGGGKNHRIDMGEQLLIKDNHWESNYNGVVSYLKKLKKNRKKKVEVEIDNFKMLHLPEILNADIIMLDNFSYTDLKKAVSYIRKEETKLNKKIEIEVSGNVKAKDLKRLSKLNINRISVGAITHSAESLDLSLEM